jgi:hypothetical protein
MKIEASWEMLDSRNMAKSRALKSMLLNVRHHWHCVSGRV